MKDRPLTFKQLASEVLAQSQGPMTVLEIWSEAKRRNLHARLRSVSETPTQTLSSDLQRATQGGTSEFKRVGARPRRYWLAARGPEPASPRAEEESPVPELSESAPVPSNRALQESALHPLLARFAHEHMGGVLVKTIHHQKSKKTRFGEWLHPDQVGVLFPQRLLDNRYAIDVSTRVASLCVLYSFELKISLSLGNLREAFFQAVSNSSWAHEGYLVASTISAEPDFMEELERLSKGFGIGVIRLEIDSEKASRVEFPAQRKAVVDWITVDKLAEMNPDFASFLMHVDGDLKTGIIHEKEYDDVERDR